MILRSTPVIQKFVILMMMVVMCLPCSVKREIKHAMGIAVSTTAGHPAVKVTGTTASCEAAVPGSEQSGTVRAICIRYTGDDNTVFYSLYCPTRLADDTALPDTETRCAPVAVYILHEHYLI